MGTERDQRIEAAGGWCAPTDYIREAIGRMSLPPLEIPAVSVRRGGIRWPKRRHVVRREHEGAFARWIVVVEDLYGEAASIEGRFWRRRAADRLAHLLNRVELDAFNSA